MICHSQGCVVASILSPANISKIVFLAPPNSTSSTRFNAHFAKREGASIDNTGAILVPRKDGTTTIVSTSYIEDLDHHNVPSLYRNLSKKTKLTLIVAKEDEILGGSNFSYLSSAASLSLLPGDHNFSGQARTGLMIELQKIFS